VRLCVKSLEKMLRRATKNADHADFKSVENVLKKCTKKVISKTSLINMSKSGKSTYLLHVFANNFFWYIFKKNFQQILNQREIQHFEYPS
jgi:hypothetical protein